jgi:hypothetical protein
VIVSVCLGRILPAVGSAGREAVMGDLVSDSVIYVMLGVVAVLILRINARTLRKMAGHSARQEEMANRRPQSAR